MDNEYYGAASTPTDDFLAHYGIKGMKWGVRKAIQRGSERALGRQYKKAQKKLAKLEKLANNGKKFTKKAVAYGTGAAVAGTLAGVGPGRFASGAVNGASNAVSGVGKLSGKIARPLLRSHNKNVRNVANALNKFSQDAAFAGARVKMRGGDAARAVSKWGEKTHDINKTLGLNANSEIAKKIGNRKISNNALVRIGSGAVGAGLGIAAARNAYRAATAKKHAQQAQEFRAEMNKAFAGTKYASKSSPSKTARVKSTANAQTKKKRKGSNRG